MIIVLILFVTMITLFHIPMFADLLYLVELPWEARRVVMIVAVLNFISCWASEKVFNVYIARFVRFLSERIHLWVKPYEFQGIDYPPARLARIRKWTLSGKRFKIIRDQFRN